MSNMEVLLGMPAQRVTFFFFFNDTATTEIYTLSLHDALPIYDALRARGVAGRVFRRPQPEQPEARSEEHTSELQSQSNLVCRLLLEKKKTRRLPTQPGKNGFLRHVMPPESPSSDHTGAPMRDV